MLSSKTKKKQENIKALVLTFRKANLKRHAGEAFDRRHDAYFFIRGAPCRRKTADKGKKLPQSGDVNLGA